MNIKNVWILHHYSTPPSIQGLHRPYYFAKNLPEPEIKATIFSSSYLHYANKNLINNNEQSYEINENGVRFIYVKTRPYNNRTKRVLNMIDYYKNVIKVSLNEVEISGKPDVIIASSAHPLALLAGKQLAKKLNVKCIFEIRDLWPESFVAYNIMSPKNPILKVLYAGEKFLYKIADGIIFTMEGGKDYIINKGWDLKNGGPIDINKVYHINNGVDLEEFDKNVYENKLADIELDNPNTFKVVYTGSIRKANNVRKIIDAAKIIKENGEYDSIQFLIYGDGDQKESLDGYVATNNIKNVKLKGYVKKDYIPSILIRSDLNVFHFKQSDVKYFGASLNKLFEYFASGKPTISDCEFGYDQIKKYNCGVVVDNATANELATAIIDIYNASDMQYEVYCNNARKAARDYDYKSLGRKLLETIKGVHKT